MFSTYVMVTVLAAAANVYAAAADFMRPAWLMTNMQSAGVPHSWVFPLGAVKLLGALGLLMGFVVPPVGLAAAVGLVLFFVGAVVTLLRVRDWAHIAFPTTFLALAVWALAVQLTAV